MKKYAYKMIFRDNENMWKEVGAQTGGSFSLRNNPNPVDMEFANKLGEDGFEMFQVVQYGLNSAYYFRKEI